MVRVEAALDLGFEERPRKLREDLRQQLQQQLITDISGLDFAQGLYLVDRGESYVRPTFGSPRREILVLVEECTSADLYSRGCQVEAAVVDIEDRRGLLPDQIVVVAPNGFDYIMKSLSKKGKKAPAEPIWLRPEPSSETQEVPQVPVPVTVAA